MSGAQPSTSTKAEHWDSHARYYDESIGNTLTRGLALELISTLNGLLPLETLGSIAFDNGCGTGFVTRQLAELYPDLAIVAADISPGMVRFLDQILEEKGHKNVQTKIMDATALDLPDESFTHTLSTAMIGSTPDPLKAAKEMHRVTKPGGLVGISSWSGRSWPEVWEKAVRRALNQPKYMSPTIVEPSTSSVEGVRALMTKAGFELVSVHQQDVSFQWRSTAQAMDYFFGQGNPIASLVYKGMGDEDLAKVRPVFKKVFEEDHPDPGSFHEVAVVAVAWRR